MSQKITPSLWFDNNAEEAANHYVSIFPNGRIVSTSRYTEAGPGEPGSVMVVEFELDGQRFTGINGGPQFPFSEAVSFQVDCADQDEVDYFWERLGDGGQGGPCGWLKDRFGVSWQIVPREMSEIMGGSDPAASRRAMEAMFGMKKLDIAALRAAAAGDAQSA